MNYLRFLIGEAVESINCPQITLKVTKTDMPFITEEWLKSFFPDTKFTVTEGKKIKLGIIAESADGRMVYDNSLNAIIKRKREAVRRQVAEKSFMDLLNEKL